MADFSFAERIFMPGKITGVIAFLVLLFGVSVGYASDNKISSSAKGVNKSAAPVPTPLLKGKKVFVSFDPGDVLAFPSVYSGGPERAYNELYADLKQWGHYTLVSDPQDADLIFAVRFVETPLPEVDNHRVYPLIRLVISDEKTHVVLWGFVEQVDGVFKKNRDKGFSNAVEKIVNDVQELLDSAASVPFPGGKS